MISLAALTGWGKDACLDMDLDEFAEWLEAAARHAQAAAP